MQSPAHSRTRSLSLQRHRGRRWLAPVRREQHSKFIPPPAPRPSFSHSRTTLITQGNVYVWRLVTNGIATSLMPQCKFAAHNTFITRVLLSPDTRQLATCSADHTARIWKVELTEPPDFEGNTFNEIADDIASPMTASTAAAAAYRTANTDPSLQHTHAQQNSNAPPSPPPSHTSTTQRTGFNTAPRGSISSFTGMPNQDAEERAPKAFPLEATLGDHQRWVWDCAFSADSAYLVTACSDHYARLWDLAERTVIRQYQGHHRGLVCVALNDYSAT